MTIAEARAKAAGDLAPLGSGQLDADVILKWILGVDETYLLFHSDTPLTEAQQELLADAVQRRKTGLAVCYITGRKEFFALDFAVTRDVLPPKPDTELLVENTIELVRHRQASLSSGEQLMLCDVCTGSGCVGVSVMAVLSQGGALLPPVSLVLTDVSAAVLSVAQHNATRLLHPRVLDQVSFIQSDLFESLPPTVRFDVIAANPPYVPHREALRLLADGRGEPLVALCGDEARGGTVITGDGLDVTRHLVRGAREHLKPGGSLVLETGEEQVSAVQKLMAQCGFSGVEVSCDLAGKPRNVQGKQC